MNPDDMQRLDADVMADRVIAEGATGKYWLAVGAVGGDLRTLELTETQRL
jgi:hypothetical protein